MHHIRIYTYVYICPFLGISSVHRCVESGVESGVHERNVFVARARTLTSSKHFLADLEHLGGFKIPCNAMPRPAEFQDRNKGRFPCPKCTSTFNRKNNLYSHLKFECGQLPRFGCPYCDYASKKSSNIRAHVRRKHHGYKVNVINVSRNAFAESATAKDESPEKVAEQTF